jgi:hypothetical protein
MMAMAAVVRRPIVVVGMSDIAQVGTSELPLSVDVYNPLGERGWQHPAPYG